MDDDKDGGQAFPGHWECFDDKGNYRSTSWHCGMTLRDYFAGQALAGLLAAVKTTAGRTEKEMISTFGNAAYSLADAMLAARKAVRE